MSIQHTKMSLKLHSCRAKSSLCLSIEACSASACIAHMSSSLILSSGVNVNVNVSLRLSNGLQAYPVRYSAHTACHRDNHLTRNDMLTRDTFPEACTAGLFECVQGTITNGSASRLVRCVRVCILYCLGRYREGRDRCVMTAVDGFYMEAHLGNVLYESWTYSV